MKNLIMLYNIERKKFIQNRFIFIFAIYLLINLFICGLQVRNNFDKSTQIAWYMLFEASIFIKVIICPIMIASIVSYSVQVEHNNNMWKILKSSGVSFDKLFIVKFIYIFQKFILVYIIEFLIIYVFGKVCGITSSFPFIDSFKKLIGIIIITFTISMLHYLISLYFSNQVISLSVAIVGSLMGIISIFISKVLMYLFVYSWFGFLMQVDFVKSLDVFNISLRELSLYPIFAGLILGTILFVIGKNIEVCD